MTSIAAVDAEFVAHCLRSAGIDPASVRGLTTLAGGVSNDVIALDLGEREVVLKRALAQLRVAATWCSDPARIRREVAFQRWLGTVLEPGEAVRVLWEGEAEHAYLMDRAPRHCLNWKEELLAGRVDPRRATLAGDLLGRIHAFSAGHACLRERFGNKAVFTELRLDPYFRHAAAQNPWASERLLAVAEECARGDDCLVHGDYSPKNILLDGQMLVLLDHEVAHYGNPAFDLGFFFCHLLLKLLCAPGPPGLLAEQPAAAWSAYLVRYPEVGEARWLPVLGACLLARVDGKSPAEYLGESDRPLVRELACGLLNGETSTVDEAVRAASVLRTRRS